MLAKKLKQCEQCRVYSKLRRLVDDNPFSRQADNSSYQYRL